MKVQITFNGGEEYCDICEKGRPCVQLFRNARRDEREHFLVFVCQDCAKKILAQFEQTETTTTQKH